MYTYSSTVYTCSFDVLTFVAGSICSACGMRSRLPDNNNWNAVLRFKLYNQKSKPSIQIKLALLKIVIK
jgi:hypothetical protein